MCVKIHQKLGERSPLKYAIVRSAIALYPRYMVDNKEAAVCCFKILVVSKKKIIEADKAQGEYNQFFSRECVQNKDKFKGILWSF